MANQARWLNEERWWEKEQWWGEIQQDEMATAAAAEAQTQQGDDLAGLQHTWKEVSSSDWSFYMPRASCSAATRPRALDWLLFPPVLGGGSYGSSMDPT